MRILRLISATLAVLASSGGTAMALEPVPFLSEEEIKQLVSGVAFKGEFFDDVKWREDYHADGTLFYESRGQSWVGDWHADGPLFCTFYRGATNGGCYFVTQLSANCYYFYTAGVGMNQPEMSRNVEDRKNWYARGWRTNAASTCPNLGVG